MLVAKAKFPIFIHVEVLFILIEFPKTVFSRLR